VSLLGMEWEDVHVEACRWEHVMSDAVERRLLVVLGNPTISPYGNPIPGLEELVPDLVAPVSGPLAPLAAVAGTDVRTVVLRRIAEPLQTDGEAMLTLRRVGANPGASIQVQRAPEGILIGSGGEYTEVSLETAAHLLVDATA
jgi:DtxR family Mn-dependent transcriptional regulator